ncbi:MAG: hypothetical protein ACQEXN_00120 [Actinomycetota bacterium]
MEFAIIIAILLVACIAWVVLGARADRRPAKGARAPVNTEAASTAGFGATAYGGDAGGGGGGDCG